VFASRGGVVGSATFGDRAGVIPGDIDGEGDLPTTWLVDVRPHPTAAKTASHSAYRSSGSRRFICFLRMYCRALDHTRSRPRILPMIATTRENRRQVCRSLPLFASPGAGHPKRRTLSPCQDLPLKTAG